MPMIVLPDGLYLAASQLATREGYKSIDDYVAELVRRDVEQRQVQEADRHLRQAMALGGNPALLTPDVLEQHKRDLAQLLLEGLDSGPVLAMSASEWECIRREFRERRAQRNKP